MRSSLGSAVRRLAIFMVVCLFAMFAMVAIFAELRFQRGQTYRAAFANVTGLEEGQFVRIAGVEVGKVKDVSVQGDATALVEFGLDDSVILTEGTRALIRYGDLIGGRYLELEEGAGSTKRLKPGDTIPLADTAPALDLDALIGGFRPLFRALDPDQVNALSSQLIKAFQGQGATISSFLAQTAALTNTLADRDELIGQVIINLNTVLGSITDQSGQFAKTVDSLSELVQALADRKTDITTSVAYANEAAKSIADLLDQSRPAVTKVVAEADRTSTNVLADKDYFSELLRTLPEAYQLLGRQGLYGDFFSFYLCDLVLKVNGKGGQPVFIKLAGQSSGRCTPK